METAHRRFLERHIEEIIQHISLKIEDYLISLLSKEIIHFPLVEAITAQSTVKLQAFELILQLTQRGPLAFLAFIDTVKMKSPALYEHFINSEDRYLIQRLVESYGKDSTVIPREEYISQ
jgi:hypothetical protein